jgi:hypothetical protein
MNPARERVGLTRVFGYFKFKGVYIEDTRMIRIIAVFKINLMSVYVVKFHTLLTYAFVLLLLGLGSGTGSYPFPPHGLQLRIRRADRYVPLKGPCLLNASIVYCEQVGV